MSNIEEPLVQTCPSCGAQIDVSDQEPLSAILCPVCGAPSVVAATIDHFELLDELGRGGMGVVYRAQDTSLARPVALKLLRKTETTGPEQIAQLETEAAITASINHPHVVKVFTTGMDHGRFYIAMELVDKGTLDNLIELQGRVAEAQVLEVGIQIASGLRAAQQAGLIHRDIKPGNILFADAHTAKIVDFGLAIFLADEASMRGEIWGTPYYVAPEKLDNKPEDFRSDIYSLGGTLFHALAGRPPFEAENASLVALKHLKSQAVSLQTFAPWVSSSTSYVINKTLSKDPDQRYQSYDELIEHLEYARTELMASGGKPKEAKRVVIETEQATKTMGLMVFGMIGLIIALGIAAFVFRDKIFKGDDTTTATETVKTDKIYPEACAKLADGDAAAAAAAFKAAGAQEHTQPKLNWANLLEGLSDLAAGQGADSYAAFKQIQERGPFSKKPEDQPLATFFLETAKHMTDEGAIAPSVAKAVDAKNYEAIIPLLYGMKDWDQGKVDDAMTLLRQFRQMTPSGNDVWIAQLAPFATAYIEEFTAYQMATDRYKSAKTFMEKKTAVAALKQIKGRFAKPVAPILAKGAAEVAAEEKKRAQLLAAGKIPPDVYKLVNRKSGKILQVEGRSKDDGHKLQQWGYSGANNEKWKVVPQADGFYEIIGVDSGKALNVPQAQTADGIPLNQATLAKPASPSQLWKIEKTDGNFYKITAQASGKALAIGGDVAKDGSPIVQTAYTGAPEQQWKVDLP